VKKVVISAASIRLEQILNELDIKYEIDTSKHGDLLLDDYPPEEYVKDLSYEKAKHIAVNYHDSIVITEESIVCFDEPNTEILGNDSDEKVIKNISGGNHDMYTGITIIDSSDNFKNTYVEKSSVYVKEPPRVEIQKHINLENFKNKPAEGKSNRQILIPLNKIGRELFDPVDLPIHSLKRKLENLNLIPSFDHSFADPETNRQDDRRNKSGNNESDTNDMGSGSESSGGQHKNENNRNQNNSSNSEPQNKGNRNEDSSGSNFKDKHDDHDPSQSTEKNESRQETKTETQKVTNESKKENERKSWGFLGYLSTTDVIILFIITAIAGIFAFGIIFTQLGLLAYFGF
jgi:septum formation protein